MSIFTRGVWTNRSPSQRQITINNTAELPQDSIKGKALLELERLTEKKQQQIDALKKRMNSSAKPIDDATNEQRIEFWREYFARKGIKE